jgi:hypothetical protein
VLVLFFGGGIGSDPGAQERTVSPGAIAIRGASFLFSMRAGAREVGVCGQGPVNPPSSLSLTGTGCVRGDHRVPSEARMALCPGGSFCWFGRGPGCGAGVSGSQCAIGDGLRRVFGRRGGGNGTGTEEAAVLADSRSRVLREGEREGAGQGRVDRGRGVDRQVSLLPTSRLLSPECQEYGSLCLLSPDCRVPCPSLCISNLVCGMSSFVICSLSHVLILALVLVPN